jgi:hypothetical protein
MGIETVVAIVFLGLGCGLFTLKDWETIEFDGKTQKLTIKRSNSLPPAN